MNHVYEYKNTLLLEYKSGLIICVHYIMRTRIALIKCVCFQSDKVTGSVK